MATRRQFLYTTLAVSAVPAVGRTACELEPADIRVVVEPGCDDTALFAARLGARTLATETPTGLVDLFPTCQRLSIRAVVGMTRNAAAFLAQEFARDQGYRLAFQARHDYRASGLQHELRGDAGLVAELAGQFARYPAAWPELLAARVRTMIEPAPAPVDQLFTVPAVRPRGSPGYLVTWALVASA